MNNLTIADLHWCAGFLEGDGSFTVEARHPRISVSQVEPFAIEKLQSWFGGWIQSRPAYGYGKKPYQQWRLGGPNAVSLMFMLHDLLTPRRREQIMAAIAEWKTHGTRSGEGYYNAKLSDEEAMESMQLVRMGEPVTHVAKLYGISHASLVGWLRGTRRPSLLKRLETGESTSVFANVECPPLDLTKGRNKLVCDIQYTAGFLEAEGCMSSVPGEISLQGIQADLSPLEKLQMLWGGYIYECKHRVNKAIHVWRLNGANAAALMMTLYPLMSSSRQAVMKASLTRWKSRAVMHGATHRHAKFDDVKTLEIMRRARSGESMNVLENEYGISHTSIGQWMLGKSRPYLLAQLKQEELLTKEDIYNASKR